MDRGSLRRRVRTALVRARFDARVWLGDKPVLYHLVVLVNWVQIRRSQVRIHAGTDVVLDGFPSSGNSFSVSAVRFAAQAEGRPPLEIAHHLHCPRQVMAAVRRGVPTVLLVRDPAAAVISVVSRWPALTTAQVMRAYVRYYRPLVPLLDRMVVATFDATTKDFGAVTEALNDRFGSHVPVFDHTPENAAAIYPPRVEERRQRREIADARRPEVDDPALAGVVERARALHRLVEARAPG